MITITLQQIKDAKPCRDVWRKILAAQGPVMDRPFPLAEAIDSNGVADTLWALRCIDGGKEIAAEFARWCAQRRIELVKPYCSADDYALITRFLETGENAAEAARAARDARDAAWDAARAARAAAAAAAAARAAARAAEDAAWDAARGAAWAAEREAQVEKLRELLG